MVEPDTVLRRALVAGLGPVGPLDVAGGRRVLDTSPLALAALERDAPFDVIDMTREFLAQSETNRAVLAVETLAALLGLLAPDGLLSLPVSIREFPVYAVQAMVTAEAALSRAGVAEQQYVAAARALFLLAWFSSSAGHRLLHASAWKEHLAIYPLPPAEDLDAEATAALEAHSSGASTLKLLYREEFPTDLVDAVVRAHVARVAAGR